MQLWRYGAYAFAIAATLCLAAANVAWAWSLDDGVYRYVMIAVSVSRRHRRALRAHGDDAPSWRQRPDLGAGRVRGLGVLRLRRGQGRGNLVESEQLRPLRPGAQGDRGAEGRQRRPGVGNRQPRRNPQAARRRAPGSEAGRTSAAGRKRRWNASRRCVRRPSRRASSPPSRSMRATSWRSPSRSGCCRRWPGGWRSDACTARRERRERLFATNSPRLFSPFARPFVKRRSTPFPANRPTLPEREQRSL